MRKKSIGLILVLVLSLAAASQARIIYIDATDGAAGNTRLVTGEEWTAVEVGNDGSGDDGLWRRRPGFGNGNTIYESCGDYRNAPYDTEDCPRLVTSVDVPEGDYEVYVYFWDTNSTWRLRASLEDSEGQLPLFLPNDPNIVPADEKDFDAPVPLVTTSGGRIMWQVPLGTTGTTKKIQVYVDDDPSTLDSNKRTWFDGIGIKALPPKINYVDATEGEAGNTALAAGGVFASTTDGSGSDNLWRGRAFGNEATIFESGGSYGDTANPEDCPRLVTTAAVPENEYAVYAYFWSDASGWRIQAALADAAGDLPLYVANDPNGAAKLADVNDFAVPVPMVGPDGNRYLWQVFLGNTGRTTSISVYVDDDPNHLTHNARTWYDGIGYRVASLYTAEAPPEPIPEPPLPEGVDPGFAGLVAYYPFEGSADDLSGNGLNGTIGGAPSYAQGPTYYGMAIDFHSSADGAAGDYVDCGASPLFDLTDAMTVGVWVNIRSIPDEWRAIVTKGDSAWRLATNSSSRGFQFAFSGADRGWLGANTAKQVELNEWHYICGTYDKTNGAVIYLDGRPDGTNADKGGIDLDTYNVWIGADSEPMDYKPGRYFDGMMDEVRIYNRALSQAEVVFLAGK
jgi:hypothetical protein